MSILAQNIRRSFWFNSSASLRHSIYDFHGWTPLKNSFPLLFVSATVHTSAIPKSLLDSNVIRILRNKIRNLMAASPPHEPATRYGEFTVTDKRGERRIMLFQKFGDEDILIEVTMFDGFKLIPKSGDDEDKDEEDEQDLHLHLRLVINIFKRYNEHPLLFICSSWPDHLEIKKVYIAKYLLLGHYDGPNFRKLSYEMRKAVEEMLKARGVDDSTCVFLHRYMMNKSKIEHLLFWENTKSFIEA